MRQLPHCRVPESARSQQVTSQKVPGIPLLAAPGRRRGCLTGTECHAESPRRLWLITSINMDESLRDQQPPTRLGGSQRLITSHNTYYDITIITEYSVQVIVLGLGNDERRRQHSDRRQHNR